MLPMLTLDTNYGSHELIILIIIFNRDILSLYNFNIIFCWRKNIIQTRANRICLFKIPFMHTEKKSFVFECTGNLIIFDDSKCFIFSDCTLTELDVKKDYHDNNYQMLEANMVSINLNVKYMFIKFIS